MMSSPHVKTMLKALLLAVMLALATAARTFPTGDVNAGRNLLEYDNEASEDAADGAEDASELGNSNEAVELESHEVEVRMRVLLVRSITQAAPRTFST
jgi:hypothetical protein